MSRTLGPAVGAGVGLRVEAPIARIVVLGAAALAHREPRHRRQRPVVGDAPHDREARPAVGAVDERIAVAAIAGVEKLGEAVGAGRRVGRDRASVPHRCPPMRRSRSRLARIATSSASIASTTASGGASVAEARRGSGRRRSPSPSTSSRTPRSSLRTQPASSSSYARRNACGRKPTPWTVPVTRARARGGASAIEPAPPSAADGLDQLAERVIGARLRLLDPRDVLRAGDDDVVGEASAAIRPPS